MKGKSKEQITAFIVETNWPGVEVVRRCHFHGVEALYERIIRFQERPRAARKYPAGGRRFAWPLTLTLDTGRLTLPAACAGLAKRCLEISRQWAHKREQWGAPVIGKHAAIADKITNMAAHTFAMEAMTLLAASHVDRDRHCAIVRLEAAMCKLWGTENA